MRCRLHEVGVFVPLVPILIPSLQQHGAGVLGFRGWFALLEVLLPLLTLDFRERHG